MPESVAERVQESDAAAFDIPDVACDEGEVVHKCRCGQKSVDRGQWVWDVQPPPAIGNRRVHGQDSISECLGEAELPLVECLGGRGVAPPDRLDSAAYFAENEDAGEQGSFVGAFKPGLL